MQVVPGPGNAAARAKISALAQQGQAALFRGVIARLPLHGFPEHAGEKLRHRCSAPRGEYPRFPQIFLGKGDGDVLVSHDDLRTVLRAPRKTVQHVKRIRCHHCRTTTSLTAAAENAINEHRSSATRKLSGVPAPGLTAAMTDTP